MPASQWVIKFGEKFVSKDGSLGDERVVISGVNDVGSAILIATGGGGDTQYVKGDVSQLILERVA